MQIVKKIYHAGGIPSCRAEIVDLEMKCALLYDVSCGPPREADMSFGS